MTVIADFTKLVLLALLIIVVPFLFMLIFDLAAHLGELFGRSRS